MEKAELYLIKIKNQRDKVLKTFVDYKPKHNIAIICLGLARLIVICCYLKDCTSAWVL